MRTMSGKVIAPCPLKENTKPKIMPIIKIMPNLFILVEYSIKTGPDTKQHAKGTRGMSTGIKPIMPATHTAITTKRENTPAFTKSRTLNLFTYKKPPLIYKFFRKP